MWISPLSGSCGLTITRSLARSRIFSPEPASSAAARRRAVFLALHNCTDVSSSSSAVIVLVRLFWRLRVVLDAQQSFGVLHPRHQSPGVVGGDDHPAAD